MPDAGVQQAAPESAVAVPQVAPAPLGPSAPAPLRAQLARSASAMGNQAFMRWASTGAPGVPPLSAREAWGVLREPAPAATDAPAEETDDSPEPIVISGLKFGKSLLDGEIPAAGGDLSKTFNTSLGKSAAFGPYSLQVPLFPGIFASFGAGGAMSANANASLTLSGTNSDGPHGPSGPSKKQEVKASGTGDASGTISGSLVAGLSIGIPGAANVGIRGQGTMTFNAGGNANFTGSIKRFKVAKPGENWLPWSGEIKFNARIKGSLFAEASGYFEYQVLWIFRDQFGHFKIGAWTLAEAGLDVEGTLGPGKPLQLDIKPWVGQLLKPGVSETLRARTAEERKQAEKLAQQGAGGAPPISRKAAVLSRAGDPPPDDPNAPPAAGGDTPPEAGAAAPQADQSAAPPAAAPQPSANAAMAAIAGVTPPAEGGGGGVITLDAAPKIEEGE
jgi:hypothetical protein